jgi:hypothetical protein
LSDDRVILRKRENRFFIYGTPWHGEARFVSPMSVFLNEIFILQHSDSNQLKILGPIETTSSLITRSFPTFWNAKGMEFAIEFLMELNRLVPCYELGFRPGPDVVDYVRCLSQAPEATNRIIH